MKYISLIVSTAFIGLATSWVITAAYDPNNRYLPLAIIFLTLCILAMLRVTYLISKGEKEYLNENEKLKLSIVRKDREIENLKDNINQQDTKKDEVFTKVYQAMGEKYLLMIEQSDFHEIMEMPDVFGILATRNDSEGGNE